MPERPININWLGLKVFNWVKIDIRQAVDQRFTLVDNHAFKSIAPKASFTCPYFSIFLLEIDSVSIAATRWMGYLKRKTKSKCPNCGKSLNRKEHFPSDFYIGGFAMAKCDAILTCDRGIYRKYFPDLKIYNPAN